MQYILKRKKIKNMYLKIQNQKIIVTAPQNYSFEMIDQFVKSKKDWIEKHLENQKFQSNKYEIHDKVRIFGEYYDIKIADKNQLEEQTFIVENESQISSILRKMLESYAKKRFLYFYEMMQSYFLLPKLKFSYLKGKWGVCYTKKKEIVLSYKLIHCSKDFIDYVIVHELVHLIHPNHSKHFYYAVERFMPNYKTIIKNEATNP